MDNVRSFIRACMLLMVLSVRTEQTQPYNGLKNQNNERKDATFSVDLKSLMTTGTFLLNSNLML